MKDKELIHQASRASVGTTISRLLGYLRDMLVAFAFGAQNYADAFYAAYRIPNLFRRLFGEGSMSSAFVPVLSEYCQTKSDEETKNLVNVVLSAWLVLLIILCLGGITFSKQIVSLIAYGFKTDPEKLNLTISLTQIMFPFILFAALAAISLGVLNTFGEFFVPAVAPASLSIAEIIFVLVVMPHLQLAQAIIGLGVAVVVGGAGQYFWQYLAMKKLGFRFRFSLQWSHPGLKKIFYLLIPVTLGLSVDQINAFVDTICASFLSTGAITALYYSNRVMQLPLAIFAIAISTVSLPAMSRSAAANDLEAVRQTLNSGLRYVIFLLVPASLGLMALGKPIIQVLFQRGRFDQLATDLSSSALFFYSVGLLAFGLSKVLVSCFYAFQETSRPVKLAVVCLLVNATFNVLLMGPLGVGGLALASSIASWLNVLLLGYYLRSKLGFLGLRRTFKTLAKVVLAALVMAAGSLILWEMLARVNKYLALLAAIGGGLGLYFRVAKILKIDEHHQISKRITSYLPFIAGD